MLDLRLAIRALRATPVVAAVAILSLALGIGANTAIFSLVNSLLLRSLPIERPDRLVTMASPRSLELGGTGGRSYPVWEQVRARPQLFDGVAAWGTDRFNMASTGETQFIDGLLASGSYFRVLGVRALVGRTFSDADDQRGGGPDGAVAVLGYDFWLRRFGGSVDVIGQTLVIERAPFTIIGVTPPDFFGMAVGRTFDIAIPLGDEPLVRGRDSRLDNRNFFWLTIVARLKPSQTIEAAKAALLAVEPQIREATMPPNMPKAIVDQYMAGREGLTLIPTATDDSGMRGRYRRPLWIIMAIVALVLLIASANIANLLLARAAARRHELSVRLALGATRWHVVRHLMAESVVLAVAGAGFGLFIATWGSRLLVRQLSTTNNTRFSRSLPRLADARVHHGRHCHDRASVSHRSSRPDFRRLSHGRPEGAGSCDGRGCQDRRSERAHRRSGRVVGRPGRRRGSLRPDVCDAGDSRPGFRARARASREHERQARGD